MTSKTDLQLVWTLSTLSNHQKLIYSKCSQDMYICERTFFFYISVARVNKVTISSKTLYMKWNEWNFAVHWTHREFRVILVNTLPLSSFVVFGFLFIIWHFIMGCTIHNETPKSFHNANCVVIRVSKVHIFTDNVLLVIHAGHLAKLAGLQGMHFL